MYFFTCQPLVISVENQLLAMTFVSLSYNKLKKCQNQKKIRFISKNGTNFVWQWFCAIWIVWQWFRSTSRAWLKLFLLYIFSLICLYVESTFSVDEIANLTHRVHESFLHWQMLVSVEYFAFNVPCESSYFHVEKHILTKWHLKLLGKKKQWNNSCV